MCVLCRVCAVCDMSFLFQSYLMCAPSFALCCVLLLVVCVLGVLGVLGVKWVLCVLYCV